VESISRFEQKLVFPSFPPRLAAKTTERKNAMAAFLKSDLFLRFLGGFVIGAIGVFVLQPNDDHPALTSPAMAAPASAADDAAL
jgi:hypothetical protein